MENILSRYRNLTILVAVLFLQVLGLAVQVQRPAEGGGSGSLLRSWVLAALAPAQKAVVSTQDWVGETWRSYFYLRNVHSENRALRDQVERLRIENLQLSEAAHEAQRLHAILGFQERFIAQTVAARVIGSSGTDSSRVIYIDKGSAHGITTDMAVVTPLGVVGKTVSVLPASSQVLLISDQTSGLGALLEGSRLHGIVRGMHGGHIMLHYVLNDESVELGERVLASGGDRIFPKGFPIGTVAQVSPGSDVFLDVRLVPAAPLNRLEEVLVVTRMAEEQGPGERPLRAADVLSERLPSVPPRKEPPPRPAPRSAAPPSQPAPAETAGPVPAPAPPAEDMPR
jgi:rod shape-determining protein MreC